MSVQTEQKQGMLFAIAAFLMWGLAPIYFKSLDTVAAMEILVHRVVWSFLFLAAVPSCVLLQEVR
jgi:chloramphenicol-sensitive protein RarD